MPTRFGTIFAQWGGWQFVSNTSLTATIRPNSRDITASAAISRYVTTKNDHFGQVGILSVVSNGAPENFSPVRPHIQRDNVTEIRFRSESSDVSLRTNLRIDYWQ